MQSNRRSFLRGSSAIAIALGLSVGLAACGNDDKSSASTTPAASATGATATTSSAASTSPSAATSAPASSSADSAAGPAGTPSLDPRPLPEKTKLRITIPIKLEAFAQVLLADEFGEFEKENLDVEFLDVPGTDAIQMLGTDRADIQTGGLSIASFNAIQDGIDLAWVATNYAAPADTKAGLWVSNELFGVDGKVDEAKVKAATFAFGGLGLAGTPISWAFVDWFKSFGIDIRDVKEAKMNTPDMLLAIESGAIQGGLFLDPYWQTLEESGEARLVVPAPSVSTGGYIAGPIRHQKPEVLDAFIRALARTTATYLQGDYHADDRVVNALSGMIRATPEQIKATPSLVFPPSLRVDPEVAEKLQSFLIDIGALLIDTPLPIDEYVDMSSVDRVLGKG